MVLLVALLLAVPAGIIGMGGAALAEPTSASVVVKPQTSGPPGTRVEVVGLGFDTGQPVEIRWDSHDGQQLADAVGQDFTAQVVVPDAKVGPHTLVVLSRDANGLMGSAAFTGFLVTATDNQADPGKAAPAPSGTAASSPVRSTPGVLWAAVIGSLLAIAAALVWARRRQHRDTRADHGG